MKIVKVSRESIRNNFKGNYKRMIGIFAAFIVLGLLIGAYQAKTYEPHKIIVNVDINKPVQMNDYPDGEKQIYDLYSDIKTNADQLEVYYQYLLRVNTSEENRVKIEDASDAYGEFYYSDLKDFIENFKENPAAAEGYEKDTVSYYDKEAEEYAVAAEDEQERLNDVLNGSYSSEYKSSFQDRAERSIARQKALSKNFAELSEKLGSLSDEQIAENRDAFYKDADKVAEFVNEEGNRLDQLLKEISQKEDYELIYNRYLMPESAFGDINEEIMSDRLGDAVVYAKSIEGTDTRKERFWASLLFFMMAGAAISILYGALYESKSKSNC